MKYLPCKITHTQMIEIKGIVRLFCMRCVSGGREYALHCTELLLASCLGEASLWKKEYKGFLLFRSLPYYDNCKAFYITSIYAHCFKRNM